MNNTTKKKPLKDQIWRLKPAKQKTVKGVQQIRNGEPRVVDLMLWETDSAFHGGEVIFCCDCGLKHFHAYELFTEKRHLRLQIRSYRFDKGTCDA